MAYQPRHHLRTTPSLSSPSRLLPRIATQPTVVDDTCSCFSIICRSPTAPGSCAGRGRDLCHSTSAFPEINAMFVGSASRIFDGECRIWPHRKQRSHLAIPPDGSRFLYILFREGSGEEVDLGAVLCGGRRLCATLISHIGQKTHSYFTTKNS